MLKGYQENPNFDSVIIMTSYLIKCYSYDSMKFKQNSVSNWTLILTNHLLIQSMDRSGVKNIFSDSQ